MEQHERKDWDSVNKLLEHRGFKPVRFADPFHNENLSDLVLLHKDTSCEIRNTLRTIIADSDRREALLQEFIQSNDLLKQEVQEQKGLTSQHSKRAMELEGMLHKISSKVQDMESRYAGKVAQHHDHQSDHVHQLQQEKQEAQSRCLGLEQKLAKERDASAQLQKKLYFTIKEEERRLGRWTPGCQHICKRHPSMDQHMFDVIDLYDTQSLKEDSSSDDESFRTRSQKDSGDVTPCSKAIIKLYQDQLKESNAQREELKSELQHLKRELEARPTVKELKSYKQQLRRMDMLIKQNNNSLAKEAGNTGTLEDRSSEKVTDPNGLCAQYRHLLNEIGAILRGSRAPVRLYWQKPTNIESELVELQDLLPTLEAWAKQLHSLDRMLENISLDDDKLMHSDNKVLHSDEKVLRSANRKTLASMVSHFQTLFDVRSLNGVYPRMNQLYTRLAEMTNAMRNLKDVLNLDEKVTSCEIVNKVAKVISSPEHVGLAYSPPMNAAPRH